MAIGKISKKQIIKTYENIISMAQLNGKTKWETPVNTNNGKIFITVELHAKTKKGGIDGVKP